MILTRLIHKLYGWMVGAFSNFLCHLIPKTRYRAAVLLEGLVWLVCGPEATLTLHWKHWSKVTERVADRWQGELISSISCFSLFHSFPLPPSSRQNNNLSTNSFYNISFDYQFLPFFASLHSFHCKVPLLTLFSRTQLSLLSKASNVLLLHLLYHRETPSFLSNLEANKNNEIHPTTSLHFT